MQTKSSVDIETFAANIIKKINATVRPTSYDDLMQQAQKGQDHCKAVEQLCSSVLEKDSSSDRLQEALASCVSADIKLSPTFYAAAMWKRFKHLCSLDRCDDSMLVLKRESDELKQLDAAIEGQSSE